MDLESLLVKLLGDGSSYQKMMKDATEATLKMSALMESQRAKEEELEARRKRSGVNLAGVMYATTQVVQSTTGLMSERFKTTGETMGELGTVAQTIPGPWGRAVGAVLRVGAGLVDYFRRDLIANQRAATQEFRNLAAGATDLQSATANLKMSGISESLGRMADRLQEDRLTRVWRGVTGIFGQGFSVAQRNAQDLDRAVANVTQRQRMFNDLHQNATLTALRAEVGVERAILGFRERRISLEERFSRRVLMSTMGGGETFRAGITPEQAMRSIEMNRLARQGITLSGEALARLEQATRAAAGALYQGGLVNAFGDLAENLANANRESGYTIQTMGLESREAETMMQRLRMARIEERIAAAGTSHLNEEQLRNLRAVRQALQDQITVKERLDRAFAGVELGVRQRQQSAQLLAQLTHLREQQGVLRGNFEWVVDTTAQQTKVNELVSRGAEQWRIDLARREEAMTRLVEVQRQMSEAARQVSEQQRPAFRTYEQGVERLDSLLGSGRITQREYNAALVGLSDSLIQASQAQERLNMAMNLGQLAATGSAEAAQRLERQQEHFRVRTAQEQAGIEQARERQRIALGRQTAERRRQIYEIRGGEAPGANVDTAAAQRQAEAQRQQQENVRRMAQLQADRERADAAEARAQALRQRRDELVAERRQALAALVGRVQERGEAAEESRRRAQELVTSGRPGAALRRWEDAERFDEQRRQAAAELIEFQRNNPFEAPMQQLNRLIGEAEGEAGRARGTRVEAGGGTGRTNELLQELLNFLRQPRPGQPPPLQPAGAG